MNETSSSSSYWKMVWRQFKKKRPALFGLTIASLLFIIALFAPFIAGRLPFVWTDELGVRTYPLLREFFAPVNSQERVMELCYNYMLLLLPAMGVLYLLLPRRILIPAFIIAAIFVYLPFHLVPAKNQSQDYQLLMQQGRGVGVFPPIPYGPYQQTLFSPKLPPTWVSAPTEGQKSFGYSLFGSDEVGRDVLVRMIYGARISLSVGFISISIATAIGLIVGSIAGYYGGFIDIVISRIIEIVICFPTFFLILTIIAMLPQRSIINIMLVIGLTSWTGTARVIRGEILKQRRLDYVTGARAIGASDLRIIFVHILPNAIGPVLVGVSFGIASAILTESGLSFLGLGVSAPTATWGELLHQGRDSPLVNWWLSVFPGIAIFLAMISYNLIGEGLRDAMDPRLRG